MKNKRNINFLEKYKFNLFRKICRDYDYENISKEAKKREGVYRMKKIISIGLLLIIVLSTVGFASEKFVDTKDHWANENIKNLSTKNIINGYPDGTFKPNDEMTRAEFITVLLRSLAVKKAEVEGKWYDGFLVKANDYGYINDKNNIINEKPNEPISRLEVAITYQNVLVSVFKGTCNDFSYTQVECCDDMENSVEEKLYTINDSKFKDIDHKAVDVLSSIGVITGYPDDTFRPNNNITRAEVLVTLERMFFVQEPIIPVDETKIMSERERLLDDISKGIYPIVKMKQTTTDHLGPFLYTDTVSHQFSDVVEEIDFQTYNEIHGFNMKFYDKLIEFKEGSLQKEWDKILSWDMPEEVHGYISKSNFVANVNTFEEPGSMAFGNAVRLYLPEIDFYNTPEWTMAQIPVRDSIREYSYGVTASTINNKEFFSGSTSYSLSDDWEEHYPEYIKHIYVENGTFNKLKYFEDRYETFFLEFANYLIPEEHSDVKEYLMSYYPEVKEAFSKGEAFTVYAGKGEIRYQLTSDYGQMAFEADFTNAKKSIERVPTSAEYYKDLGISTSIEYSQSPTIGKYFGKE